MYHIIDAKQAESTLTADCKPEPGLARACGVTGGETEPPILCWKIKGVLFMQFVN